MSTYKRNYPYTNVAGMHWPDTHIGSKSYYAIDLSCSVDIEKEAITSVTWFSSDEGLKITDSFITETFEAHVKLEARKAGYYMVRATVESLDAGVESTTIVEVNLKVM